MEAVLADRLPWFIAGPLIGLVVVALYALTNEPLGASGAYFQVTQFVRRRRETDLLRVWVFVGILAGGLLATLLRGGPRVSVGYGLLGAAVPLAALVPILFFGGVLIGYGARWAGGCTSGHGVSGTSMLSPASLVATVTFMATAIAVSFALNALLGGVL